MIDANIEGTQSGQLSLLHPTTQLLAQYGITSVGIIDDSYDDIKQITIWPDEAEELWSLIEFNDEVQEDFRKLGIVLSESNDINAEVLSILHSRHHEFPATNSIWVSSSIGVRLKTRTQNLIKFTSYLKDELKLEVHNFGRLDPLTNASIKLYFLDWVLAEDRNISNVEKLIKETDEADAEALEKVHEEGIRAAVEKAKEIIKLFPDGKTKPLIVLVSSYSNVVQAAESFCNKSGLLRGMFFTLPKRELSDPFTVEKYLQSFAMALPVGQEVQSFIDSLRKKLEISVKDAFLKGISALSLSDYAFIQRLTLHNEGHPLGDYLVWLFGAYFNQLLFDEGLKDERKSLDRIQFKYAVPAYDVPSLQLAKIYQSALFDSHVGPVEEHSWSLNSSFASTTKRPKLFLGDVFKPIPMTDAQIPVNVEPSIDKVTDDEYPEDLEAKIRNDLTLSNRIDLYLIINNECDLSFSPEQGVRPIDDDQPIFLVPGYLRSVNVQEQNLPSTDFFVEDDKRRQIDWDVKKAITIRYDEFTKWQDQHNLERIARLRLPYALEIQRRFAANITRVGLPISPPMSRSLKVQLLQPQNGKLVEIALEPGAEAFLVDTKAEQRCSLTFNLIIQITRILSEQLPKLAEQLEEEVNSKSENIKKQDRLNDKINKLSILVSSQWRDLFDAIKMPSQGKSIVPTFGKPNDQKSEWPEWAVKLTRDKAANQASSNNDPMLLINLALLD